MPLAKDVPIEDVKRLYIDQSMSIRNVGLTLHISTPRVKGYLSSYNIPIRPHNGGNGTPIKFDDAEMDRLYLQEELSPNEIAKIIKASRHPIVNYLKRRGIYTPRRPKPRRGPDSPLWKGGRFRTVDGYIEVRLQPDDFYFPMCKANGGVREHRLVMAKYLNRCLLPWEIVHHKNGIRDDNRIENLKLLPTQSVHLPSIHKTMYIRRLEERVNRLEKEVRLLKWQLKEATHEWASHR